MKELDARGLACPAPVLQTKAAIEEKNTDELKVIVDNEASRQNVCRFLESNGYQTSVDQQADCFIIAGKLREPRSNEMEKAAVKESEEKKIMGRVGRGVGSGHDNYIELCQ